MSKAYIDVGLLVINSLKSIINDKTYLIPFVLPVIWLFVAFFHFWFLLGDLLVYFQNYQYIQNPSFFVNFFSKNLTTIALTVFFYGIIFFILFVIAMSVVIKKYQFQRTGEKLEVGKAFFYVKKNLSRIFGTIILAGLILFLPILLVIPIFFGFFNNISLLVGISMLILIIIIIPWVYISLRLALVLQTCVMEYLSPVENIKKCWGVTKGNVLNIFVVSLVIGLISSIFVIPFQIIGYAGFPIIQIIGLIIIYLFTWPFSMVAMSALYYEIRFDSTN